MLLGIFKGFFVLFVAGSTSWMSSCVDVVLFVC